MGGLKILIADDQKVVRELFARILQDAGHVFDLVRDGSECLDKLAEESYDLLFVDLIMPGVDGVQVLKKCREAHPDMDVVVVSVQDDERAIQELLSMGATAYVTKPFTAGHIHDLLARVMLKKESRPAPQHR